VCLFGHTHVPAVYQLVNGREEGTAGRLKTDPELDMPGPPRGSPFRLKLEARTRYFVNCGAVGQPRDGDPRAAYGILDTAARTVTILRAEYDVVTAQSKIITAGLPEVLAQRLAVGR
jgi:diadenosine tetraphosphatase ApaH/serine/threonine PP2A family protein phosphatase